MKREIWSLVIKRIGEIAAFVVGLLLLSSITSMEAMASDSYWKFYARVAKVSDVPKTYTYTHSSGALALTFDNPVIIAGAPTYNGSDPCLAQVSDVTSTSFKIQVGEWDYDDGAHTGENIPVLALEAGHRTEGSATLEAGVAYGVWSYNNHSVARHVTFSQPFSTKPYVFATSQTLNGTPFSVRVANVTTTGFDIYLQEEEAKQATGHGREDIGYLAIQGGTTSLYKWKKAQTTVTGFTYESYGSYAWEFGDTMMDHNWTAVDIYGKTLQFKLHEETSVDSETYHISEKVGILNIWTPSEYIIFTQDYSFYDGDTFSIRRKN